MSRDAWAVLGLRRGASPEEVRARYLALARAHHPDKHPEQAEAQAAYFKEVTAAYRELRQQQGGGGDGDGDDVPPEDSLEDWRRWWSVLEAHVKQAARAAKEETAARPHRLTLPVSLADVQLRRRRKVLLTLKEARLPGPVLVDIDCGAFPEWRAPEGVAERPLAVAMALQAEASAYRCDSFEEGVYDLFYEHPVSLADLLSGGEVQLPALEAGGAATGVRAVYAPLPDLALPLEVRDAGLWRLGAVFVALRLQLPAPDRWAALPAEERARLVDALRALSA